jgi:hypothetical protein
MLRPFLFLHLAVENHHWWNLELSLNDSHAEQAMVGVMAVPSETEPP